MISERIRVLPALLWWAVGIAVGALALAAVGPSTELHRRIAATGVVWPGWLADGLVLVLVAGFLLAVFLALYGRWTSVPAGAAAAVGVVIAYASSKIVKLFISQERPCLRVVPRPSCPEAGDWSFPSNHATIAFGLATAIVVLVGGWWIWSAYLVALLAAAARVLEGVHYPHDVLAGAALGVGTTVACVYLLAPLARWVLAWLTRSEPLARLLGDWSHTPRH